MIETTLKIFFATFVLLAATMPIEAATINARLQEKIDANPMQFYSAYIVMTDNSAEPQLARSLGLDLYTREAGHAIAVKHLKDKAKASQTDLLEYLGAQSALGHVSSYKGYWIDNVVGVTAKGSLLGEISRRSDIEAIYGIESVPLIVPISSLSPGSAPAESIASALKVIGADSMWALGYTGEGRIVCSFDTGIDGTHPALSGSWRGNNGYSWEESWFDPVFGDSVPHTTPTRPQHGTHTMGIMVGHDDATGDTVGVAPGAQWISAAVVYLAGQRLLEAFEWAADPVGNPNTVTDVPDVISHSWGYKNTYSGCEDVFWGAIDNLEALGAVCIFAAGNDGGGSTQQSIRNPANRASSPYNTFAVGMIDPTEPGFPVFYQSSRGPSDCDGVSLKPQVAAPGVNIWSTVPVINGSYNYNTGTSMACPHVAAAVALLRQYNPNAPVDSIKKALMETAIDIEEPGTDFKSGHGLIYIPAALEVLVPNNAPNIFISTITNKLPDPGDAIEVTVSLGNSGLGLADVIATLRSENPDAVVTDSSFFFGNISMGGEANNDGSPFEVVFDADIVPGTDISLTLHITGSDSYAIDIPLVFTVGERAVRSTFVHDVGNVSFGASNYGIYGFAHLSVVDLELPGFTWPNDGSGENNLYEMGLLIATDENHVSDNVRNPIYKPDNDFEVSPGGDLQFLEPGPDADEESFSIFDDSRAEHPIGVRVSQRTLAFADSPHDDYVMIVYGIRNTADQPVENLVAGIFTDWDWPYGGGSAGSRDRVGFEVSTNVGYMYSSEDPEYRGVAVLSNGGATSFRAIKNSDYTGDDDGGTDREKWEFMTGGIVDTSNYLSSPDHSCLIASGPFNLAVGGSVEVAFAIIGAPSVIELRSTAGHAREKYVEIVGSVGDTIPPSFTVNLLPNPVLPFELDVIACPSEPLLPGPDAIITAPVNSDTIGMTQLCDRDAATYSLDYQIEESGPYTISVCGADTANLYGCSETTFSAALIHAEDGASLVSYSGLYELTIPPLSFSRDALLLCWEEYPTDGNMTGLNMPSDVTPVLLIKTESASRKLKSHATLTVDLNKLDMTPDELRSVVLLHLEDEGVRELDARLDLTDGELTAEISALGTYLIGLSSAADDGGDDDVTTPSAYRLDQNWPNPFNTGTTISFNLSDPGPVKLDIYNILGQKVVTLVDKYLSGGSHDISWDGTNSDGDNCGSGVYFYRLKTDAFSEIKRMLLLK